ncbi:hypothetical protein BH09PSE4_BH09PSE4_20600 [soil metagenome]
MKRLLLALLLVPAIAPGTVSAQTTGPQADPACMKDVPWEVDPTSGPIKVYGCRPVEQIGAPDAQGWSTYTRAAGNGWIRSKTVSSAYPAGSVWTIIVEDNGGGSGVFGYTVVGAPDANNVLQNPKVTIYNGN